MKEQEIRELLEQDVDGLYSRFRENNYEVSLEEKQQIISYLRALNGELKNGTVDSEKVRIAIGLMDEISYHDDEYLDQFSHNIAQAILEEDFDT